MTTKEEYLAALDRIDKTYNDLDKSISAGKRFNEDIHLLYGLVNEHFEEKESNLEHYKDEIKHAGYEFALVNGKPTTCRKSLCDQCYFNDKHFTCARKRIEWMLKPFKRKYKLTQFEYDLLRTNNMSHDKRLNDFATYENLREIGYFNYIDFDLTINEVLANCEVIKDA